MAWTTPKTWALGELVDESDLNTHVRDNLLFLKSNPVIASAASVGSTSTSNNTGVSVITTGSVSIPADIGACFVEVWTNQFGMTAVPATGHNDWGMYVSDGATAIIDNRITDNIQGGGAGGLGSLRPLYTRSGDLAWAGLTKTVTVYVNGFNSVGGANGYMGPTTVRIVRSY